MRVYYLIIIVYLLADLLLVSTGHPLDTMCLSRVWAGVQRCLYQIRVLDFGVWSRRVREKRAFLGQTPDTKGSQI